MNAYCAAFLLIVGTMLLCFLVWLLVFTIRVIKKMKAAESILDKNAEIQKLTLVVSLGIRNLNDRVSLIDDSVKKAWSIVQNAPYSQLAEKIGPIGDIPSPQDATENACGTSHQNEQQDGSVNAVSNPHGIYDMREGEHCVTPQQSP